MAPNCGACAVCEEKANQKCANCQTVFYCSREHQKQHWKRHKPQCSPTRLAADVAVGRHLRATRDLAPGDVLLREKPLITGPAQVTPPVCLGCYRLLEEKSAVPCEKCGWPVCSTACAACENHTPECSYTVQRGEKVNIKPFGIAHPNYQCIAVLRCLYQRDNNVKLWSRLQALESHCKERKDTEKWRTDKTMISDFILKFFKLEGTFTDEEIMRCCGIVQVNGHEVPLIEPGYVAVYDRVSMLEHSCRANCGKSFSSCGEVIVSAGMAIEADAHLSVCYTDSLWGTETRRHHLAETKFFECACRRCADPTELATMFSAVKCQHKACKGYLLPETFLQPLLNRMYSDSEAESDQIEAYQKFWTCNACKDQVNDGTIQQLLEAIGRELNSMPKEDPETCEKFIEHCSKYLHPSHFYITDVAMALAQMIGQQHELGLAQETDERLMLKTQLCRKLADLLEILVPAENRARGSILFELHAAIAESGRRKSLTEGPTAMIGYVSESRKILAEAATLLRHEPPELPEGKVARQARLNLLEMDKLLLQLSANLPAPL